MSGFCNETKTQLRLFLFLYKITKDTLHISKFQKVTLIQEDMALLVCIVYNAGRLDLAENLMLHVQYLHLKLKFVDSFEYGMDLEA